MAELGSSLTIICKITHDDGSESAVAWMVG